MKRFVLFFVLLIMGLGVIFAQNGQKLSYQAVIRNSANQLVTNTRLEVTIGIANSEDGAAVYTEHHTVTTNANGLISLMIGTGDNRTGDWGQIEWEHAYVTTNTVVDGVPVRHKVELTAVAHAFYADDVDEGAVVEVLNNHGIEDGAEPNVQGDWNQENAGADDYIKNKPTLSNVAISGDYNDLINKPLKSALCDSVQECVTGWISDSTRMVFDTLHTKYATTNALKDSLTHYVGIEKLNDTLNAYYTKTKINDTLGHYLQADALCDSIVKCGVIKDMRDSIRTNAQNIQSNSQRIATNETNITSLQAADNALSERIKADSLNLLGFKTKVKADSATLVSRIVADSTALHKAIKDTAAAIRADIHDSVLVIKQGNVVLGTFSANQNHNDTINIPTPAEQAQADWNQTTTTAKDYIKNKPNIRDSVNRVVLDSLAAANSAMNRAVDTISRHNIHDSLVVIRTKIHTDSLVLAGKMRTDSIDLVNRIVTDSTALATRMDTLLNHVCDSVKSCVTGWISDSTRMVFDTLHTKYATTNALRDSLTHYVGIEKLNDTLGHYLQADALCDSIVKCGVIKDMRDSIQTNAQNIQSNSQRIATNETNITSLQAADNALSERIKADSLNLLGFKTKVKADSATLVSRIVADSTALHKAIKDTAAAIRADIHDSVLVIKQGNVVLGTFSANQNHNDTINIPTPAEQAQADWNQTTTTAKDYIKNKPNIRDSVNRVVLDSLAAANSAMNRAVDTISRHNIHDSLVVIRTKIHTDSLVLAGKMRTDSIDLVNRIVTDSTALATRMDTLLNHVCDSVKSCVTGWISDSTRMVFDTLHTKYATTNALRDSLTHYVGIEKLNDTLGHYLQADALCDSIVKCGVIKDMRDSIRTNAQNIQSNSQRIATNETNITSLQAADNALSERIKADSLNLLGFKTKVKADSATLVSRIVADSTALHKAIKDTAAAIRADIHDSVLVIKQGNVVLGTFSANQNHNDTINIPTPAEQAQADWNQTTTTAKDYIKNKPNIRDSVNRVVLDSLAAANSAMNRAVDTISRHNIHDSLVVIRTKIHTDSLVLAGKMRTDSIDLVNRIVTDSTALATRMDTLLNHVCDSVKSCVTGWISDSTRMVFDTLHTKYATTNALRDSLTHYVGIEKLNDTLGHYLQADALCDSIVKCGVIKDMRDSIRKVDARLTMDSTVLAEKIRSDSSTVHGALVDSLKHYMDSTQVVRSIHDSIGNGTLTISYGTVDSVKFTANQKTNGRITIPAQVNADWNATEGPAKIENKPEITTVNDATLTIQKNGTTVGTFTANQATGQTIDIKVPTCDSLAECDLIISILARLDRLERANDSLAKEIEKLQPALTVSGPQKDTVCAGSTKSVTYTATFHNCSSSDYTLAWKVNGTDSSNVTGSKLILNVETAGQYVVVCIATRSDSTFVTDTVTTTVTVDNDVPSFTIAIEGLKVTLSDVVNTATIQWDTDSLPVPSSGTSVTHTYAVADTITITAISERGCTFTKDTILQPIKPEVTTVSIPTETIKATEAKVNGKLNSDGGIPTTRRGVLYSISNSTPRLGAAGVDSVINGAGMGDFTCDLRRLVPCSPYYVCAFAINEVDTAYGEVMTFSTPSFTCGDTLIDIDDNKYATLLLGSQCWMKQNLRTTHFADGTEIPKGGISSSSYIQPFYYEPDSNIATYGRLYNWVAAMHGSPSSSANPSGVQGVCPDGWHLPSDAEWTQLTSFVASDSANVCDGNPINIAKALASNEGWEYFDTSSVSVECYLGTDVATNNKTQFSVLPTGTWEVGSKAGYTNYGHSIYRTATEYEQVQYQSAYARQFYGDQAFVERTAPIKEVGYSVRCVLNKCPADNTPYAPTVSPVSFTDTVGTTVTMTASVISDGGATVTERGVCWGTASQPTTDSAHTASGTGIGDFSVNVTSLTPGTTYYVRAYATNSEGTAYGAEVIYVAPNPVYPPVVNTGSQFLALSEGFEDLSRLAAWSTIDNDGDGKNWGITNQKAHNGTLCAYSASWLNGVNLQPDNYFITPDIIIPSDVSPILTFWYRGSENSLYLAQEHFLVMVGNAGASTANDFNDTLLNSTSTNEYLQATVDLSAYVGQTISLAFVHSTNVSKNRLLIDDIEVGVAGASAGIVSDVTATTANCGGFVSGDGGATVTARGVCWSTSENPTVSDNHTTDGSGTGSFTSNITGLSADTTYYVRAYAINSADTSYGDQVSFTTLEALPKVTTSAVSNINVSGTNITATCGGDVTDQGAYEVTARGVCWGTSDPTIDSCHTDDGSGLHSFVSSLTGLSSGTTYYVRAYATNSAGTAYGNQVSFTLPVIDTLSCDEARTVTDHEGNVYATVKIGTQCWMRENLRTTTSPKTGTYLVNTERLTNKPSQYLGSKVAHWFNNDSTTYAPKGYGLLYNWNAAMDTANLTNYLEVPTPTNSGNNNAFTFTFSDPHRGICPEGWHVPNYNEWLAFKNTVGSSYAVSLAYGSDWNSWSGASPGNINHADRNASGFTAFPVGMFGYSYMGEKPIGSFKESGERAYFWCSMQMGSDPKNTARIVYLSYSSSSFYYNASDSKGCGFSVRCIKD